MKKNLHRQNGCGWYSPGWCFAGQERPPVCHRPETDASFSIVEVKNEVATQKMNVASWNHFGL